MCRLILATILIAGALGLSDTERCFLSAIHGGDNEFHFDRDEAVLKSMAVEFNLLPKDIQSKIRNCGGQNYDDGCEAKFGKDGCEQFGLIRVKKCQLGFKRVDAGICAAICPAGTSDDAGGALCVKPPISKRSIYTDQGQCHSVNLKCEEVDGEWVSGCPANFKPLGKTMCTYDCPAGFVDSPRHCVPPRQETPEYFLPRFEPSLEAKLTGLDQ